MPTKPSADAATTLQAVRNHLPVDAQVPAGLGTATGTTLRSPPSGCPGVFGPVPQPVSMDGRILPVAFPDVNRFMPMKRLSFIRSDPS